MSAIKSGDMNTLPLFQSPKQLFQGIPIPSSPTSSMPDDTTVPRRTSRDWDEIMGELIRGLEQICGPKTGRDPNRRSAQLDFILSPAVSNPPSPPNFHQELRLMERGIQGNSGSNDCSLLRRHSDESPLRNRSQRAMFVRHIETHEDLNSKLFDICRKGSLSEVVRTRASTGEMWGAARLAMNTALASKSYPRTGDEERGNQRLVRKHQRRVRFQVGDDEREIHVQLDKDQRDIRRHSENDQRDIRPRAREDQSDICFHVEADQRDIRLHSDEDRRDIRLASEEYQRDIRLGAEEDETDFCLNAKENQSDIRLETMENQSDIRLETMEDQSDLRFETMEDQIDIRLETKEDQSDMLLPMEKDQLQLDPIQVEVGSRDVEDLVVSVRDRRHLTVEAISGFGDSILYDSLLSDDLTSGSLLCHLTANGQLFIRRQSPSLASENFVGTGSTFIPIICRNEASLELTVVLHIPEDFLFDDVTVRTVDSQLIVIGRKRSLSLQPIDGDLRLSSHNSVRPTFRVFVQLPKEVNCRSVNASLTEDHQLIVKGEIDPLPRRNSL